MANLIDYSSSESEPESKGKAKDSANASSKSISTATLPPLPTTFHTLYATNVRTSTLDDPSLHSGRVRQIPHAEGTWPSHIQLEWHPSSDHSALLTDLLSKIASKEDQAIHSLFTSPLGAPTPLHISLSRTLPVLTDQRATLLEQLRVKIRESNVQFFTVHLTGGLKWVSNEDGSRYFLVVKPDGGFSELETLLRTCNKAVKDCGLGDKGLYDGSESEFHFSIAWRLGSMASGSGKRDDRQLRKRKRTVVDDDDMLQKVWKSSVGKAVSDTEVFFDKVMVRIGNAVHAIDLPGKRTAGSKRDIT